MLRTTLTAAWSRKRRLIGTALAVVLGVSFLMATLVLGASARAGFETAFGEANAGTDALVRSADQLQSGETATQSPFDAATLDAVVATEGVERAVPVAEGFAQILGADGAPLGGEGPPTLGATWIDDPDLTGYELAEGRAPAGPGEVVIDRQSADDGDLSVGDRTTLLTPAPLEVTIVGVATFGDEDSLSGVTLAAFTLEEAQRVLLGGADRITGIIVSGVDGVDDDVLAERLGAALPEGLEAITGADLTAEQQDAIEGDFLGFLVTGLLAFAGIAVLVAAFSIFNTFSILAAQRTRESALLRTLGASRAQVLVSGLVEATFVGVVGAGIGVGLGILLGQALLGLLDAIGFGLPVDGIEVTGGHVAIAALVGILVTMAGALVPAWRASRVAPLAALREAAVDTSGSSTVRAAIGGALAAAGAGLVAAGVQGDGDLALTGLGGVAVLVAMVLLGPVAARPFGMVFGAPLRLRGVPGDLARRNAVRNPRRTSATAAALLVGVGVVSLFTVFASSIGASIEDAVDRSFAGDLVVEAEGFSGAGLSPALLAGIGDLPEVDTVAGLGWGAALLDGEDREVGFADLGSLAAVADFDVVEGSMTDLSSSQLGISTKRAEAEGWALGDEIPVGFVDGATEHLEVGAIYDDRAMGGDVLIPAELWRAHVPQASYVVALVGLADGVAIDDGQDAVEAVTADHGAPQVQDRDEFVDAEAAEVDAMLGVVYGLLAIAILIALMGIGNTLALSVHERTRELGLLRAVGQTRSQLRAMVRWESVLVATFGAAGGVAVGSALGWAMIRAIAASEGLGTFRLPATQLVVVVVIGGVAGVLAGLRPAWRAARLDVLDAVAAE